MSGVWDFVKSLMFLVWGFRMLVKPIWQLDLCLNSDSSCTFFSILVLQTNAGNEHLLISVD